MKNILCADIGGTNSRFAHFTLAEGGRLELRTTRRLITDPGGSLAAQFRALYAGDFPLPPARTDLAVLAVAGPVAEGRYSKLPLVGWEVDLELIRAEFGFTGPTRLINDFTAQALAILSPIGVGAQEILPGRTTPEAPIAIIGAGTGLGKALLHHDERGVPLVISSEGGHADFAFAGGQERQYLEFLLTKLGAERISGNTVVSGPGLSYLHQFLTGEELLPAAVTQGFLQHPQTLEWAARFYGRACRNFVLETLALGGVYIAGGVAAKAPELLTHRAFEQEFHHSPTMGDLLAEVPVRLLEDDNSGLWGGAVLARQLAASDGE